MSPRVVFPFTGTPPTTPTPDLEGFATAQRRLRAQLGVDVAFHIPQAATYAGDVDPESGQAFDPWEDPTTGGDFVDVVVRCSIVNRPLGGVSDSADAAPIGLVASDHIALIVDESDYGSIVDATAFTLYDQHFKITEKRPDSLGAVWRYIVYATKA